MRECAELAQIRSDIERMPMGYESLVDHAGGARGGREGREAGCQRRGARGAEARRDELGAATEEGVRDRDRHLCPLPGTAAGDREHRGAGGDRAHPGASGAGLRRGRAGARADRRAGATAAGQVAVTLSGGASALDPETDQRRGSGSGAGPIAPGEGQAGKEGDSRGVAGRINRPRGLIGPRRRRASIPIEPLRSGRARCVAVRRAFESTIRGSTSCARPTSTSPVSRSRVSTSTSTTASTRTRRAASPSA